VVELEKSRHGVNTNFLQNLYPIGNTGYLIDLVILGILYCLVRSSTYDIEIKKVLI
jgi:hypothetical protein